MFYFIGLGLGGCDDVTVKGLEIIKKATRVYLEAYTSILSVGHEALQEFYGRELILADRETVEQQSDTLLENSENEDVAFLVVGDPFGATTHTDLLMRAAEKGIPYRVVHNASIMNAIGCCGLQLYRFGETVSLVMWTDTWQPDSYFDKIVSNKRRGLHTLCLLDIKMKEQTVENLMRGRKIYEPPRFMTAQEAASQLCQIAGRREKGDEAVLDEESLCVAVSRVGSDTQQIVVCSLKEMTSQDLGAPLHSLVIPGSVDVIEAEVLALHALNDSVIEFLKTQS